MFRRILVSDLHHLAQEVEKRVFQIVCLKNQGPTRKPYCLETRKLQGEIECLFKDMETWKQEVQGDLNNHQGKNILFR
jgi:hypothetical protein